MVKKAKSDISLVLVGFCFVAGCKTTTVNGGDGTTGKDGSQGAQGPIGPQGPAGNHVVKANGAEIGKWLGGGYIQTTTSYFFSLWVPYYEVE